MAPKKSEQTQKEAWTDEHTNILLRGMITHVLLNRSTFYAIPKLSGVADHGGDRINKKLQQVLKKVCDAHPGANGLVEDVMKGLKGSKASTNGGGSFPTTPKKRKVKSEE
ncbi:hypothetical protein IAU59_006575 [Kwoniella sp. CBS 9459]